MINLCYRIFCLCLNLWKVYGLGIIFDFCMNAYFLFLSIQSLKRYQ